MEVDPPIVFGPIPKAGAVTTSSPIMLGSVGASRLFSLPFRSTDTAEMSIEEVSLDAEYESESSRDSPSQNLQERTDPKAQKRSREKSVHGRRKSKKSSSDDPTKLKRRKTSSPTKEEETQHDSETQGTKRKRDSITPSDVPEARKKLGESSTKRQKTI